MPYHKSSPNRTASVFHGIRMRIRRTTTPTNWFHSCESKSEAMWWRWLQPRTKANIDRLVRRRYCTRRNGSSKWAIRIRKLWITIAWINSWKVLQ